MLNLPWPWVALGREGSFLAWLFFSVKQCMWRYHARHFWQTGILISWGTHIFKFYDASYSLALLAAPFLSSCVLTHRQFYFRGLLYWQAGILKHIFLQNHHQFSVLFSDEKYAAINWFVVIIMQVFLSPVPGCLFVALMFVPPASECLSVMLVFVASTPCSRALYWVLLSLNNSWHRYNTYLYWHTQLCSLLAFGLPFLTSHKEGRFLWPNSKQTTV